MSHLFDRYYAKHDHYPEVSIGSGIQRITVTFHPGYLSIRSSSPYQAQVYITRSAAIRLVRKMIPLVREMAKHPAADHDLPEAMRQAYWDEVALLQEKRAWKKSWRERT